MSTGTAALPHKAAGTPARLPQGAASWLLEFFARELAPYPGRVSLVTRMVIGVTLTMLIIMTFHLPGGALGVYYALIISRESLRNTVQQTWLTVAFFALGTLYVMLGIALFLDSPVTHFLWVIGSFYLIFFVMGTARNYGLAAGFSFLIATAIPIWDRAGETNTKVALTLFVLLSVVIGASCTLFVELVYRSFHPQDPVVAGLVDRLRVAAEMLRASAEGRRPALAQEGRLLQYAMVGPSSLRRQLIRGDISSGARARASAVVSMTGRVLELCATGIDEVRSKRPHSPGDTRRLRRLASVLDGQAAAIRSLGDIAEICTRTLPVPKGWGDEEQASSYLPALPEIARGVRLLSEVLNSFGTSPSERAEPASRRASGRGEAKRKADVVLTLLGARPSAILVPDAFTNREHLTFALRGCLAASLCYVIYNGIDWPGINTSVATCIITALATIGSSRQKQLLRIAGAFVGGFLISLPAQVFLLPLMDSITAFTIFFAAVSALAAWFATASPRLSYFGLQIALAFYLINVQEPFEQISLAVARDRVVGVLLGLMAMWLVFDQFAAPLATERMGALLRTNLHLMGELASSVGGSLQPEGREAEAERERQRFRDLRDKINDTFSQMNAQADAVPFEFGAQRQGKLRARERMQGMQPAMRSVFLLQATMFESDALPREARGRLGAASVPALHSLLEEATRLLEALAALPGPGEKGYAALRVRGAAQASSAPVADAPDGVPEKLAEAYRRVEQLGPGHEVLQSLCTSLVSSLGALECAAHQRPAIGATLR